jgi:DNA-binding XRE family transcriptional regulator
MNEMVTIPKDEYLRLKALEEDLADLQSVAEILQRLDVGEEELIPAAVVDRLLDGQAPLLVWREYRSLSQAELARRSGVNRVQIIDIEAGRKTGSVETLRKLASTLQIEIDDLVSPASAHNNGGLRN